MKMHTYGLKNLFAEILVCSDLSVEDSLKTYWLLGDLAIRTFLYHIELEENQSKKAQARGNHGQDQEKDFIRQLDNSNYGRIQSDSRTIAISSNCSLEGIASPIGDQIWPAGLHYGDNSIVQR